MSDTRDCPLCGEEIKKIARKCRHCGEYIDGAGPRRGRGGGAYAACPKCRSDEADAATFTWWGGLVGPKLFNHVICRGCGAGFNGKTGKSNDTAIAIYLGCGVLLAIGIVVMGLAAAAA